MSTLPREEAQQRSGEESHRMRLEEAVVDSDDVDMRSSNCCRDVRNSSGPEHSLEATVVQAWSP